MWPPSFEVRDGERAVPPVTSRRTLLGAGDTPPRPGNLLACRDFLGEFETSERAGRAEGEDAPPATVVSVVSAGRRSIDDDMLIMVEYLKGRGRKSKRPSNILDEWNLR